MCHSVSGVFFYMLCSSLFIGPGSQGRKSALRLFRARATLPENRHNPENRIMPDRGYGNCAVKLSACLLSVKIHP